MRDLARRPRCAASVTRGCAFLLASVALVAVAVLITACDGEDSSTGGTATVVKGEPSSAVNVIVVMTDDQTVADTETMPATRRLIEDQGASFEDSVVSFPLCCPARATYLTGRYAHNHGVLSNNPDYDGGYGRLRNKHTLAVWMQEAGYKTAQIGRYLNFYGVLDPTEVPAGWDEWAVPPGPSTYLMYDYELNQNGELVSYGSEPQDYQTDVYAGLSTQFVRDQAGQDRPFFLSITPLAPHDENDEAVPSRLDGPRPAPRHRGALADANPPRTPAFDEPDVSDKPESVAKLPRLSAKGRREAEGSYRRRARSLLAVDDLVRDLVRTLRETDQLDDTYLILTSDNGYLLGEHRLKGKIVPYEESIRVPLLVRGPGVESGTAITGMAANIDLAPTILDLAGAERRRSDGISLALALRGRRPLPRRAILLENLDRSRVPKQRLYEGVRTPRWSYLEFDNGETELYDLAEDPAQLENLAEDPRARSTRARLASTLDRLRDCRGASCR
jgi:arylsulfatase A-like enzyme